MSEEKTETKKDDKKIKPTDTVLEVQKGYIGIIDTFKKMKEEKGENNG